MQLLKFGTLLMFGYFLAITLIQGNDKKAKTVGIVMLIALTAAAGYYGWLEIQVAAIRGRI